MSKLSLILSALAIFSATTLPAALPNPVPQSPEARIHQLEQDLAACRTASAAHHHVVSEIKLDGALTALTADVVLARPLNLVQATSGMARGVVVVNCLVDVEGRVLAVRMLQPLQGSSSETKEANQTYLEAASRLIFEPATSADGKTHHKVWQAVGFLVPAKE